MSGQPSPHSDSHRTGRQKGTGIVSVDATARYQGEVGIGPSTVTSRLETPPAFSASARSGAVESSNPLATGMILSLVMASGSDIVMLQSHSSPHPHR